MRYCTWLCPICDTPLTMEHQRCFCPESHSFDIAKEGYVNLLPAQNKKSRAPGDNKEMMRARRAFLNQGFFLPLAKRVSSTVSKLHPAQPSDRPFNILDCGCGEGYYTAQLNKFDSTSIKIYGIDISKPAIQLASKSYKNIQFAVASAFSIPLPDNHLTAVLQIFSPSADQHVHQKLQSTGMLVRITPGENHLTELRDNIYKRTNQNLIRPPDVKLFSLVNREACKFQMQLNNSIDIQNLLMMTPHFWKAPPDLKRALLTRESMLLTADFVISSYKKKIPKASDQ